MRSLTLTLSSICLVLSSSALTQSSALAQSISEAQMRAANMARMQAEVLNGGLRLYSPADCMHQGGGGSCLVSETVEGYRFRFLGGAPGWAGKREPATLETVVLVSPDAKVSRVEYNGPVRVIVNP
jgi:hypothetical protein